MYKTLVLFLLTLASCAPQPGQDAPLSEREANMLHLAQTMQTGGDTQGAIELYLRVINQSEHQVQAHLALADLYTQLKMPDKAEAILLAAKERQLENPTVNLRLAKMEVAGGDPQKALVYFDDGLKQAADNIDLLNGKAVALDMLMRHDEAQALYLKILKQPGENLDFVQNNLAMSYIMTGDYDAAIRQMESISGMSEKQVIRQNLALAYGLKGNMVKAREWGLKDLTLDEIEENIAFYRAYTEKLKAQPGPTKKPAGK